MIYFDKKGDERGLLIALEENRNIPFAIQRVFYIYGTQKGVRRGEHAHRKTKQLLVAITGSCKITLEDGTKKETYSLSRPDMGLFQDALVWGTMHDFSSDCVLMVLADSHYDESDYIRDYGTYIETIS